MTLMSDPMPRFLPGAEALADDLNLMAAAIDVANGVTASVARDATILGPMPYTQPSTGRVPMPVANAVSNQPSWIQVTDAAQGRVQFTESGLVYLTFGFWGAAAGYCRMRNQFGTQLAAGPGGGSSIIQINAGDTLHLEVEQSQGEVMQDIAWRALDLKATV
jgi:hypothetical protein